MGAMLPYSEQTIEPNASAIQTLTSKHLHHDVYLPADPCHEAQHLHLPILIVIIHITCVTLEYAASASDC